MQKGVRTERSLALGAMLRDDADLHGEEFVFGLPASPPPGPPEHAEPLSP